MFGAARALLKLFSGERCAAPPPIVSLLTMPTVCDVVGEAGKRQH